MHFLNFMYAQFFVESIHDFYIIYASRFYDFLIFHEFPVAHQHRSPVQDLIRKMRSIPDLAPVCGFA